MAIIFFLASLISILSEYSHRTLMIQLKNISKYYRYPFGDVIALKEITFHLMPGEYTSVLGQRSSGKSTLINLIACMDIPTGGILQVLNKPVSEMNDRDRDSFRLDHIGLLSPEFKLNSQMTLSEILITQLHFRCKTRLPEETIEKVMERTGIPYQCRDIPTWELSEELQIRGSIARALINDPEILLCDEPTKNLNSESTHHILTLLENLNHQGITVIIATEDSAVARRAERQIQLYDGYLFGDKHKSPSSDLVVDPIIRKGSSLLDLRDEVLTRDRRSSGMN